MEKMLNNFMAALSAMFYYVSAAVSLAVSNKWFMGLSLFLLLTTNKSLKIGKLLGYKG